MGLMQRLRKGTKFTVWILVFSFGILWVLADTEIFDAVMVGPQAMGEVNNVAINWDEYNERLSMYTEQYRERTGDSPDREMRAQFENQVWEELIADKVMQQRMDEMGLTVTDSELYDMVMGDNPAPFIRQQFAGPDGEIDRQALQAAIQDPQNAPIWRQVEQQLSEQRRQQKLNQLIESSIAVSDEEVTREYMRRNSYAGFEYVRFPLSLVDGDEIEVSDSEMRSYYEDNRNQFRRSKTWNMRYVSFSKEPTQEDTLSIIEELNNLRDDFAAADDHETFVNVQNTQTGLFDDFLRPDEVRREHLTAYTLNVGQVSEPYIYGDRVHMVKLLDTRSAGQTYTRIREIELNYNEQNRDAVEQQANELYERLTAGESFRELARQYSDNASLAEHGGEAGYIASDGRDAPLSNQIFNSPVGNVAGPVAHDGSFYLFEIVDRSTEEVRFADLSRNIEADPIQTVERQAREANDFSIFADDNGFVHEAEYEGYTIQEAVATDGNPVISGLGQSQVVLNELQFLGRGDISEPIETDEYFYVIKIDEVQSEGHRPLSEVEAQVRDQVREKKREELLRQRVASWIEQYGDLAAIAEAQGRSVHSVQEIAKNEEQLPEAGREPAVVGAVFGFDIGNLSNPIVGNNGVYVIRVTDRQEADPAELTSVEREQLREEMLQSRTMALGNIWMDRITADANISDHRGLRR